MAGWLGATRIRTHVFLFEGFSEDALIFTAILVTVLTTSSAIPGSQLSIDCGGTRGNFTDSLHMNWVADYGNYIKTGQTIEMPFNATPGVGYDEVLGTLRYFPDGRNKYCYELPTTPNVSYLIRASFYMNSSVWTERQPFQFSVSINATNWFTVLSGQVLDPKNYYFAGQEGSFFYARQEGIFYSSTDVMYFCLQRGSLGDPFISSLELRELDPTMYVDAYSNNHFQYLSLLFRYNFGASPFTAPVRYSGEIRFPDDKFDRIWSPLDSSDWTQLPNISLPTAPDQTSGTNPRVYYVPPKVMKNAWLFSNPNNNVTAGLTGRFSSISLPASEYAFAVFYTEHLNKSDSRVYTINSALDLDTGVYVNFSNHASIVATPNFILSSNYFIFTINLSSNVTLKDGPTMNACEVFYQSNFNFSTTNAQDDVAVTALKTSFDLTDWQGDPCTPVPHDWLNCNSDYQTIQSFLQPCGISGQCSSGQEGYLRFAYSVQSLNLSDLQSSGFTSLINSGSTLTSLTDMFSNSCDITLLENQDQGRSSDFGRETWNRMLVASESYRNMIFASQRAQDVMSFLNVQSCTYAVIFRSITFSEVDSNTFQFLIYNFSSATNLNSLNFSNNYIDAVPNWSQMSSLTNLDLAHNNLTLLVVPSEDIPLPNKLQELDVSYNFISSLPPSWQKARNNLTVLDLSNNPLLGDLSSLDQLVQMSGSLQELDVSHNRFSGILNSSIYFSQLSKADFSQNYINGTLDLSIWHNALITKPYGSLSTTFSFVDNSITDISPDAKAFEKLINSTYPQGILLGGNPYCNGAKSDTQRLLCRFTFADPFVASHKKDEGVLIASICGGIAAFLLLCLIFAMMWRLWRQVQSLRKIQRALAARKVQPPFYQYSDLKLATRSFHADTKLGSGGYGVVYKGVLPDETTLAVKKIFNSQTLQGLDDFLNEVVIITGIKHRNLVQLKGCCIRDKQRMLVYEYAARGNLAEALWGSRSSGGLNWEQRFDSILGVARGLAYLHEELEPSIIHRDIKPANILLDNNFKPKIADFGLARYVEASHLDSTEVAGTMGYLAPEYAMHGHLSEKVDVYSYGIVILEVVSGRKCIDFSLPPHQKFLKNMVCDLIEKEMLLDMLQPEIRHDCSLSEVICAINVALLCVQHRPEARPSMSQVVTMLSDDINIDGFVSKSSNLQSDFKDLSATIDQDINYRNLQKLAKDSSIYPMISLSTECLDTQPSSVDVCIDTQPSSTDIVVDTQPSSSDISSRPTASSSIELKAWSGS